MSRFCSLPWMHLQIDPDGGAKPCCIMQRLDQGSLVGNMNDNTFEEIWNGEGMRSLRRNMINGVEDERCRICYQTEDGGMLSHRLNVERHIVPSMRKVKEAIAATAEDGTAPVNPEYWDFRFSNVCNLKCRTCGPVFSTAWYKDYEKLGWPVEAQASGSWLGSVEERMQVLERYVDGVREIYFAGGEPLMMEEHLLTLNMLIERGLTDVRLRYNTNLSSLKYKNIDILSTYWSKFKDVHLSASIDHFGKQAEYIRSGTKWSDVEKNITRIITEANNIDLFFTVTISVFNIFDVEKLFDHLVNLGAVKANGSKRPNNFHLNMVFGPSHYSIQNLPEAAKEAVRAKIGDDPRFNELLGILNQPTDPKMIEQFKIMVNKIDAIRDEKIDDVLPELWSYYK